MSTTSGEPEGAGEGQSRGCSMTNISLRDPKKTLDAKAQLNFSGWQ